MCFSRRDIKGQTLVEAAFVLPVLFLLTFAIIEFGWYFWANQVVSGASREGARMAVVTSNLTENDARIITVVQNYLEQGTSLPVDKLVVSNTAASNAGDLVKVTVRLPYAWATPVPGMVLHNEEPPVIARESEMRYEGSPQQARATARESFRQRRNIAINRTGDATE